MKREPAELLIDRVGAALRRPTAGPLLEPNEIIACALVYAMQFEFWRREINETSMVVHAIEEALRRGGYKIVPMERSDYERA